MMKKTGKGKQGFASMSPDRQREIASMGGRSQGKKNNPGNFANDIGKAKRAGQEGGSKSRRTS
jgi:general stress protein YciG